MPTYEYRCKSCEREFEAVQAFTDDALTTCDECGGPLRKIFGSVGISFKGSGFYKNDSRGSSGKASAGGDGGSSSDTSSDSAPAAAPAAEKTSGSDTKTSDKPAKKSGTSDKAAAATSST